MVNYTTSVLVYIMTVFEYLKVVVTEVVSPAEVWINLLPDVGSGAQINSVLTQVCTQNV